MRTIGRVLYSAAAISMALLIGGSVASASSTEIKYLSGTDKDNTVLWGFRLTGVGRLVNIMTNIPVPSCWETKGFGNYQYGSSSRSNSETGNYTCTFSVPQAWSGKRVFLVFEGAFTDTSARINGRSVGAAHQGGYCEFKYDVTTNVVFGASTNLLEVTVKKWSSSTNIMRAESLGNDYWVFGGIYRPVYLEAKPSAFIDYLAVNALANGDITNIVHLGGLTTNYIVRAFVTDSNNVMLGNVFSNSVSSGASNVVLSASLGSPHPWSSEFPTLYELTVQLVDTNDVVIHSVSSQIGFRTITFTNNVGFFVNGTKVVMRGVARHEEWPTSGRTTSRAISDLDISMIKDANFNAVRMSHYPPNKVFLEECDRLGLYVLDEFASYQHNADQGGTGPMDIPDGIRLIGEMIRRDENHPCVFAWDNGNEGGWNPNLDGRAAGSTNYFALYDIQKRMFLCPNFGSDAVFDGVISRHYAKYKAFTNDLGVGKPVLMTTEILHAFYDGGGAASLQEYWDAMRLAPNGGGLFLWSWDDEGMVRDDKGGIIDESGSGAPDGIVGPFREKEASYYAYKAIYSPIQIGPPDSVSGTLAISNRFDFTDLNQCKFKWQLGWFPDAGDPTNSFSTSALTGGFRAATDSGMFKGPFLPSQASGVLVLPSFPSNFTNYDALRLTATDPFGNNIYTWTWPLHGPGQLCARIIGAVPENDPSIIVATNALEIIVTNGPRIFHFNIATGAINSITVSNRLISLSNGPRPTAGNWMLNSITNYSDGTNYVILVNDLTNASNGFQWILRPDGWLKLSYRYTVTGPQDFMGITFDYPGNKVTAMSWLGQGPYRVYKNRFRGQEVFTHTKAYNDTWTGQSTNYAVRHGTPSTTQWKYPEFAGYYGQLYWATMNTTEQPVTVVAKTSNLFFRLLTPPKQNNPGSGQINPTFPPGTISFLNGISPIGNKFDFPFETGPAGQTNVATGVYTGELNLFFGSFPISRADRDVTAIP